MGSEGCCRSSGRGLASRRPLAKEPGLGFRVLVVLVLLRLIFVAFGMFVFIPIIVVFLSVMISGESCVVDAGFLPIMTFAGAEQSTSQSGK